MESSSSQSQQQQQLQQLLQRQILRPLEFCPFSLPVEQLFDQRHVGIKRRKDAASDTANNNSGSSKNAESRNFKMKPRLLAICTSSAVSSSSSAPHEEACVFLIKYKLPNTARVETVLPIYADFSSAIVQSPSGAASTDFLLKLKSTSATNDPLEIRVKVQSLADIQRLLAELKRYTLLARERQFLAPIGGRLATNHQWVTYYRMQKMRKSDHLSGRTAAAGDADVMASVSAEFQSKVAMTDPREGGKSMAIGQMSASGSPVGGSSNPFLVLRQQETQEFLMNRDSSASRVDSAQNRQQTLKAIKEKWVRDQMRGRETEFTEVRDVTAFVGTWNVNGKLSSEDLGLWLLSESILANKPSPSKEKAQLLKVTPKKEATVVHELELPDLYVLGFQEMDFGAEAFLLNDSPREDYWSVAIENGLKQYAGQYRKVASKQLVGMLLIVYVKRSLMSHVGDVSADSAGCGIMGMMGNKGGVAIRLRIFDSYMCFINSHLAADAKEVERRNQNYQEIVRRIGFQKNPADPLSPKSLTIWDSDCVIWFGDLNYRVALSEADVKALLEEKRMDVLMAYDQLNVERTNGRVFSVFDEAAVQFWPSYKYDPGTNQFDSSEKRRAPSWCDRILYRRGDPIVARKYDSHLDLLTSDHKPVSALMDIKAKVMLKEKQMIVHQEVLRQLDQFENASLPDASISANHVSFGPINYWKPMTQSITLENTGQVIAQFRFIPKLEETHFCKPWLWINPPMSMLLPGEKLRISFTILVDHTMAPKLNTGEEKLEDILILHLENGKDYFISITGQYIPTCFGVSLEILARLNKAVRESQQELFTLSKAVHGAPLLSIPKELWRMVDYIYHFGLGVENLFLTSGNSKMMESIRECLDTGNEFPLINSFSSQSSLEAVDDDSSENSNDKKVVDSEKQDEMDDQQTLFIHSMAESLIRFLEALPISVIPQACYTKCMDVYQNLELSKQLIQQLPSVHYNAFVYLTSFLREIVAIYEGTELTKENLAMIFAAVMIRPAQPVKEKYSSALARKSTQFLLHFLSESNLF